MRCHSAIVDATVVVGVATVVVPVLLCCSCCSLATPVPSPSFTPLSLPKHCWRVFVVFAGVDGDADRDGLLRVAAGFKG